MTLAAGEARACTRLTGSGSVLTLQKVHWHSMRPQCAAGFVEHQASQRAASHEGCVASLHIACGLGPSQIEEVQPPQALVLPQVHLLHLQDERYASGQQRAAGRQEGKPSYRSTQTGTRWPPPCRQMVMF